MYQTNLNVVKWCATPIIIDVHVAAAWCLGRAEHGRMMVPHKLQGTQLPCICCSREGRKQDTSLQAA